MITTYSGDLLRTFNDPVLKTAKGDVFGRIYEYFLTKFADQKAHDGGEFFTPTSLVQMIVNVIEPDHGTVLDPTCGSGGMFVQSAHFIVNKKGAVSNGNYLWISYFYSYLNDTGRAGFVMSSQSSSAGNTKAEVRLKQVAEGLYKTIRAELARIQDFAAKQATRDEIKITIKDYLWDDSTGLPDAFGPEEIEEKTDAIFAHLLVSARHEATATHMLF